MKGKLTMKEIASMAGFVLAGMLLFSTVASAADVTVMYSGAFSSAIKELAPEYERATGNKVILVPGPSMGTAPEAIPNRLQRGEKADVVILAGEALDKLINEGKVKAGGRTDLARSGIFMAIRAGAPKPDISSVETFKNTLLKSKSIATSDSASGVYLKNDLFPRLGIADQMNAKRIWADPAGGAAARGEAELAFQQNSELLPVKGIDIVGPLPPTLQKYTWFSAGVPVSCKQPKLARSLIKFFTSPAAAAVITKTGMEPPTKK
jgi:molybdate transport system substrate-binding protein